MNDFTASLFFDWTLSNRKSIRCSVGTVCKSPTSSCVKIFPASSKERSVSAETVRWILSFWRLRTLFKSCSIILSVFSNPEWLLWVVLCDLKWSSRQASSCPPFSPLPNPDTEITKCHLSRRTPPDSSAEVTSKMRTKLSHNE